MSISIAPNNGDIDKEVTDIYVLASSGITWKEVVEGHIAPVQGLINKKFYGDQWIYKTGQGLYNSAGAAVLMTNDSRTLTLSTVNSIKPETIIFNATYSTDENSNLRFKVSHSMDGINWTDLPSQTIFIANSSLVTTNRTFTMDGETEVKYLKLKLTGLGPDGVYNSSIIGYCAAWYEKG